MTEAAPTLSSKAEQANNWQEAVNIRQLENRSRQVFEKETQSGGLIDLIQEVKAGYKDRLGSDLTQVAQELTRIREIDYQVEHNGERGRLIDFWGLSCYVVESFLQNKHGNGAQLRSEQIFGALVMSAGQELGLNHEGGGSQTDNGEGKTLQLQLATLWRIFKGDLVIRGTRDRVLAEEAARDMAEISQVFGWQVAFVETSHQFEELNKERELCLKALTILEMLDLPEAERQRLKEQAQARNKLLEEVLPEQLNQVQVKLFTQGEADKTAAVQAEAEGVATVTRNYQELENDPVIKVIFGARDLVFPTIPLDERYSQPEDRKRFGLFDEIGSLLVDELAPFSISGKDNSTAERAAADVCQTLILVKALASMLDQQTLPGITSAGDKQSWYSYEFGSWYLSPAGEKQLEHQVKTLVGSTEIEQALEELIQANSQCLNFLELSSGDIKVSPERVARLTKNLHVASYGLQFHDGSSEYANEMLAGAIYTVLNLTRDEDYVVNNQGEPVLVSSSTKEQLEGHVLDSAMAQLALQVKEGFIPGQMPGGLKQGELTFNSFLKTRFKDGNLGFCAGDLIYLASEMNQNFNLETLAVPLINWRNEANWPVSFNKDLTRETLVALDQDGAQTQLLDKLIEVYEQEQGKYENISFMVFAPDNVVIEQLMVFFQSQRQFLEERLGESINLAELKFGASLDQEKAVMAALGDNLSVVIVADNAAIGRDPGVKKDSLLTVINYGPAQDRRLARQREMRTARSGDPGRLVSIFWQHGNKGLAGWLKTAGLENEARRLEGQDNLLSLDQAQKTVSRLQRVHEANSSRTREFLNQRSQARLTVERQVYDFSQLVRQAWQEHQAEVIQGDLSVEQLLNQLVAEFFPSQPASWDFFIDQLPRETDFDYRQAFSRLETLFGRDNLAVLFLESLVSQHSQLTAFLGQAFDDQWRTQMELPIVNSGESGLQSRLAKFNPAQAFYQALWQGLVNHSDWWRETIVPVVQQGFWLKRGRMFNYLASFNTSDQALRLHILGSDNLRSELRSISSMPRLSNLEMDQLAGLGVCLRN